MHTLPTLYKKTSAGATQTWTVIVDGASYYTKFGQLGGTITTSEPTLCKGKNAGRSNATTPEQQAMAEAQSLWEKKLKKDYVKTAEAAQAGASSELVEGGVLPMLAHKFSEHGDKIKYPCVAQPKLDGHRCIAVVDSEGRCTLWSRTRKRINSVPHIVRAIERLGYSDIVLDGELYNAAYRNMFDKLTHYIRQSQPCEGHEVVQYHIYDAVMDGPFAARTAWLQELSESFSDCLRLVETQRVQSEDELMLAFEDFLAQGYEGAMARNAAGPYVNTRSYDLLKIKQFDDTDFKIVGVCEGKGKLKGHGIFLCSTDPESQDYGVVRPEDLDALMAEHTDLFSAKMKGETAALRAYIDDYSSYAGKLLTVKHQGWTGKKKVPRFPVALRVRTDI